MEDPLNGIPPKLPPDYELSAMNGGESSDDHADTGSDSVSPTMTHHLESMDSSPGSEMKDEDDEQQDDLPLQNAGDHEVKMEDEIAVKDSSDELVAGSPKIAHHQNGANLKEDPSSEDSGDEKKLDDPSMLENAEAVEKMGLPADSGAVENMDDVPAAENVDDRENSDADGEQLEQEQEEPVARHANSRKPIAKAARQKYRQIDGEPASAIFYKLRSVGAARNGVAAHAESDAEESDLEPEGQPPAKKQKSFENGKERKLRKTGARRPTARSRAKKAVEEKPTEAQEGFFKKSARWLSIAWILTALRMEPGIKVPEKRRKDIEKMVEEIEEQNNHIVDIDLDTEMPMQDNYRGVMDKVEKMVLQDKSEMSRKRKRNRGIQFKEPIQLNFTGAPRFDWKTAKSEDIVKLAKKTKLDGQNHVFGEPDKSVANLIEGDDAVIKAEQRFFKDHGVQVTEPFLSVVRYNLADNSEGTLEKLKKRIMNTSMCVITGLDKVTGFNWNKFSPTLLAQWKPDLLHPVLHQLPQPTNSNVNLNDKKADPKKWTITGGVKEGFSLKTYVDWLNNCINYSKEVYAKMRASQMTDMEVFREELERYLHANQLPINGRNQNTDATLIGFGTNIELETQQFVFVELVNEINKFPYYLATNGAGNLLNHPQENIAGLNSAQLYVKAPGSRTSIHPENSALASFNHNIGPGDCVWYGVPLEDSDKMTRLLKHHNAKSKSVGLYATANWPNEEELIKAGIHLQKFIQRPGDTVYVGAGTYHWVQSNGYTVNVSWNIAQPTFEQLSLAAVMHDHYDLNLHYALLPIQTIAWNIAEKKIRHNLKFDQLISMICMRSLARAQTEFDYLEKHDVHPRPAAQAHNLVPVERCSKCQECTHNIFVVHENESYCIECAKKKSAKFVGMTAYYRQKMTHWMKILDEFNALWREEQAAQDAAAEDAAPHVAAPQNAAPQEAALQDETPQEAASNDGPRDGPRDGPLDAPHDQ